MKAMNLFASGLMVLSLGLTACGAVKDAKNANNMEKEGTARINTMRTETLNLYTDHNILLSSQGDDTAEATSYSWASKTPEQKADIRKRLDAYWKNIARILEIGTHKGMKLTGDQAGMINRQANAKRYLAALDKAEGKTK